MEATTPSPQDVILYYLVQPPTGMGPPLTKSLRHEFKRAPRDYDGLRHEVGAAIAVRGTEMTSDSILRFSEVVSVQSTQRVLQQSEESVLKAQATVFSDCSFHLEDPDGYRLSSYDPVAEYLRTKISREGRLVFVMRNDLGTQQCKSLCIVRMELCLLLTLVGAFSVTQISSFKTSTAVFI